MLSSKSLPKSPRGLKYFYWRTQWNCPRGSLNIPAGGGLLIRVSFKITFFLSGKFKMFWQESECNSFSTLLELYIGTLSQFSTKYVLVNLTCECQRHFSLRYHELRNKTIMVGCFFSEICMYYVYVYIHFIHSTLWVVT